MTADFLIHFDDTTSLKRCQEKDDHAGKETRRSPARVRGEHLRYRANYNAVTYRIGTSFLAHL